MPKGAVVALSDLNQDGIPEYIIKNSECKKSCEFSILAKKSTNSLHLGSITANALVIQNDDTHGVRNIQAYKNPQNDYDFDVFIWDDQAHRYVERGEEHES